MAFCANCGTEVQGRFCPKCGTPLNAAGPAPSAQAGGLTENLAGALCYAVGLITGILFLALSPYNKSKFVRFHAFQAIFLHLAWVAFWIVDTIIMMMMPAMFYPLNGLLWVVVSLGGIALWIFCIVKAYNNERFKLPIIGDLAEKQS